MRVPLAILFSVCVLAGAGQLLQSEAIEVPASAYAPSADVLVAPSVEIPTVPTSDFILIGRGGCPGGVCPASVVPTDETVADEGDGARGPVAGVAVGAGRCVGKVIRGVLGHERRAARRASR